MKLFKKITILFPPALHEHLTHRAELEGTSLGALVHRACRAEYRVSSQEERRGALEELLVMDLPVGEPKEMKHESVPTFVEAHPSDRPARRSS